MNPTLRTATPALLVALLLGSPGQEAAAQELPSAATLIARHVEAIGGRDAALRHAASRTTGTFEVPAAGLSGSLVVISEAPGRMATRIEMAGLGEILSGYDGTHAWSVEPMGGPRLLQGAELDMMRDGANPLAAVRDESLFTAMETVDRIEIAGQPCYRVRLAWKSGRTTHDCYSTDSGLLVASTATQTSPMGEMEVLTRMEDYREFGGVRSPARIVQEVMGMQQVLTIREVEFGDAGRWPIEPPAAVRALIGG